eukprot:TRINITY_DN35671_c0_g1_i1.p1 TRINITY_DN35671_c0_g1~~TRINITY_DN35671_c0_g1_i1.p1  ORF type:complete len:920 (+),score=223.87 TRINITY_DN35671_c0_g1_i1:108-2867(+)
MPAKTDGGPRKKGFVVSPMARFREEFRRCTGSFECPLTADSLALHFLKTTEARLRRAKAAGYVSDEDRHIIAIRVSQIMQEMGLKHQGFIEMDEFVHHGMLSRGAGAPVGDILRAIDFRLADKLRNNKTMLEDLQWMFETADLLGNRDGRLVQSGLEEVCRRKLWQFLAPKWLSDLWPPMGTPEPSPAELAAALLEELDLDNDGQVSYLEFVAYCMGRRKEQVTLHYYDLSSGVAHSLTPLLFGKRLEGIWHTGIVVLGREYFYGGGVFYHAPGVSSFGTPDKAVPLGYTLREQEELERHIILVLKEQFNPETYDVMTKNCNHFTDAVALQLLNRHIPDEVLSQPEFVANSALATTIRPMLNKWLGCFDEDADSTEKQQALAPATKPQGPPRRFEASSDAVLIRSPNNIREVMGTVEKNPAPTGSAWVRYFKSPNDLGSGSGSVVLELIGTTAILGVKAASRTGRATANYVAAMRAMRALPPPGFSWTSALTTIAMSQQARSVSSMGSRSAHKPADLQVPQTAGPSAEARRPGEMDPVDPTGMEIKPPSPSGSHASSSSSSLSTRASTQEDSDGSVSPASSFSAKLRSDPEIAHRGAKLELLALGLRAKDICQALEFTGGVTSKAAAMIMDAQLRRRRQLLCKKKGLPQHPYVDEYDYDCYFDIEDSCSDLSDEDCWDFSDLSFFPKPAPSLGARNAVQGGVFGGQFAPPQAPSKPPTLFSAEKPPGPEAFVREVPREPVVNRPQQAHVPAHPLPGKSCQTAEAAAALTALRPAPRKGNEVGVSSSRRKPSLSRSGSGDWQARRSLSRVSLTSVSSSCRDAEGGQSAETGRSDARARRCSKSRGSSPEVGQVTVTATVLPPTQGRPARRSSKAPADSKVSQSRVMAATGDAEVEKREASAPAGAARPAVPQRAARFGGA